MPEWKEWNGSRKQLDEMRNAREGFILRATDPAYAKEIIFHNISGLACVDMQNVTHYLICEPHPLADMIIRQAQTRQPVWWRIKDRDLGKTYLIRKDTINIPWDQFDKYEFSFTPFED